MIPQLGEIYRHFKGNLYKIITLAIHSETGEKMVVYQALYGECETYVRPLDMFISEVDHEKYPDVQQKYRFEKTEDMKDDGIEPLILEFLDSETYQQKSNILTSLHHRITDEMITTFATALDIVIDEGNLEERYSQLKNCIQMKEKYECNRI